MLIRLIRNKPQGNAITGRLVIDGKYFCDTLERVGYQILALCYHVSVTMSPKFKRLLPLVTGVPRTPQGGYGTATPIGRANGAMGYRQGIRFHRGTKPEHSTGCVLVVADNINDNTDNLRSSLVNDNRDNLRGNQLPAAPKENIPCRSRDILISPDGSNDRSAYDCRGMFLSPFGRTIASRTSKLSSNNPIVGGRTAAEVENQLTQLLLKAQNEHEEIILEVTDFRPGTSSEWA